MVLSQECPTATGMIEVEVMNRHLNEYTFSTSVVPGLQFPCALHEILIEDDYQKMPSTKHRLWVLSLLNAVPDQRFARQQTLDKGDVIDWPVKFLHPSMNTKVTTAFLKELKTFFQDLYGNDLNYVPPRITKYARCTVNGQTYSSKYNSIDRGSIVKSVFVSFLPSLLL